MVDDISLAVSLEKDEAIKTVYKQDTRTYTSQKGNRNYF